MSIKVLPEAVVARIAAGEAVERPASAVKELIENAIDAGASSIHVEAAGGGRQLLRVSDNGSGIRNDEIGLAFTRHATSKLRAADDLQAVTTLGFRGEALASIAAVSQATIVTRHRAETAGVTLRIDGGDLRYQRSIGAPAGSVITVERLFFNTPARLKFLKKDATEKRHIHWLVARYAMAYPAVKFVLILDGRERFRSSGGGRLADVVARAFGLADFKRMVAVEGEEPARPGQPCIRVSGFSSLPALSRASRDRIILFVNGRAIQDRTLSHAVTQAYDGLLPPGAFPLSVALITTPADFVDVNVHPAKAEVRFRNAQLVFVALQRAIRNALLESEEAAPPEDLWSATGFSSAYIDYQRQQMPWRRNGGDDLLDDEGMSFLPDGPDGPAKPRTLPVLRVIGQIGATYIIAEGPAGLYLLDQNAAHERVLYQQICDQLAADELATWRPEETETVLLAPDDAKLLQSLEPVLARVGFEIEPFGPNAYALRQLPAVAGERPAAELLPQMLAQLRETERGCDDAVAALAAAVAVRRGQVMQADEMARLIAQLERCPTPLASPGGRKTLIHLTREQLAQEFQRG